MYHVSAQGVDERMINVHYYYYYKVQTSVRIFVGLSTNLNYLSVCNNKGHTWWWVDERLGGTLGLIMEDHPVR